MAGGGPPRGPGGQTGVKGAKLADTPLRADLEQHLPPLHPARPPPQVSLMGLGHAPARSRS